MISDVGGNPRPHHFAGLTGIRGVGAVWVFCYHSILPINMPVISSGYLGVDLFFLLSGFVLSHAYRNQVGWTWQNYHRFIRARLARILPLHLFTLGLVLLPVLLWPGFAGSYPSSDQRFGLGAFIASVLLLQNWAIWLPTCWNTPAWSLSAEWGGYLAMPVFFFLGRCAIGKKMALTACYGILILFIAVMALRGQWSLGATGTPGMVRMACEMSAGCFLYCAFMQGWRISGTASLAALAMLGLGAALPNADALGVMAMPMVILAAAQDGTVIQRTLSSRAAVFLGDISFSIYLTHWIIIQGINRLWPSASGASLPMAVRIVVTGMAVAAVSVLTYQLVELPSRRWGRSLSLKPPILST